jgi:hypothetical protein
MNYKYWVITVLVISLAACHSNKMTYAQRMSILQIRKDSVYKRHDSLRALATYYSEITQMITSHKLDSLHRIHFNLIKLELDSTLNPQERVLFEKAALFSIGLPIGQRCEARQ